MKEFGKKWPRHDTDLYEAMVISQLSNLTQLTIDYGPFLNIKLVSDMFRRVLCSEGPRGALWILPSQTS